MWQHVLWHAAQHTCNTHQDSMGTLGLSSQVAKQNSESMVETEFTECRRIRRQSKSESKPSCICSGRAGQGSGNGRNRKSTAHVNTCSVQTYVPEFIQ
jgi:hypothetical protein